MARLEAQLEEEKAKADLNYRMLDAINVSTHLGFWAAYYDDDGKQTHAIFSDEFRRMLGFDRKDFPDEMTAFAGLIYSEENHQMEQIDSTIEELNKFADDIGNMANTLYN